MELDILAPDVQLTLCLSAEDVCLRRIREIEAQADPKDGPLHRLLKELEAQERTQREEVARLAAPPVAVAPDEAAAYFPSARQRLGEAPLNRDSALYYVERIKEEASRFFRRAAQAAMDDDARAVCTRLALREIGEVARLRTVLL